MVEMASKVYLGVSFHSFYLLLREVVFLEQLLRGHDGENAEPAFNDLSSMGSCSQVRVNT